LFTQVFKTYAASNFKGFSLPYLPALLIYYQ